mgnify:CR=1 FL=1
MERARAERQQALDQARQERIKQARAPAPAAEAPPPSRANSIASATAQALSHLALQPEPPGPPTEPQPPRPEGANPSGLTGLTDLAGCWVRLPDGTMLRLRRARARRARAGSRKLFTLAAVEALVRAMETGGALTPIAGLLQQLETCAAMLDILRRACSARHAIQNKLSRLAGQVAHLHQKTLRRAAPCGSLSPIASSPQLQSRVFHSSSGEGSPLSILHRDADGLLSMAAIDEITARHRLSPSKQHPVPRPRAMLTSTSTSTATSTATATATSKSTSTSTPVRCPALIPSVTPNNFRTVLSPTKRAPKRGQVDASSIDPLTASVVTPLRKSARNASPPRASATPDACDPEHVAELLLDNPALVYVANPYIPSSPARKSPSKKGPSRG